MHTNLTALFVPADEFIKEKIILVVADKGDVGVRLEVKGQTGIGSGAQLTVATLLGLGATSTLPHSPGHRRSLMEIKTGNKKVINENKTANRDFKIN